MMKILVGNAVFAALAWGWYGYVHGSRDLMISGCIFAFTAYMSGAIIGVCISQPKAKRPKYYVPKRLIDPSVFDRIE
jgi:hypothetical protein